jgi:hypothetical protein
MDDGDLGQAGSLDFVEDLLNTASDGARKPDFAALRADKGGDVFDNYNTAF